MGAAKLSVALGFWTPQGALPYYAGFTQMATVNNTTTPFLPLSLLNFILVTEKK